MDNNIQLLLRKAEAGDPQAQFALATHYGRMIKDAETDEDTYSYSKQAMMWLKKAALQGYAPAKDALEELKKETLDLSSSAAEQTSGQSRESKAAPVKTVPADKPSGEDRPAAAVESSSFSSAEGPARGDTIPPPVLPELTPPLPDSFVPEDEEEYDEDPFPPEDPLRSGPGLIVTVLLVISLLVNAVLGFLLWRSKRTEVQPPPSSPPISDGISLPILDDDTEQSPGQAAEVGGEEQTGENTDEPAPAEPVIEINEQPVTEEVIDLAQLRRLDFIPAGIYDVFVYYTVQTDGYDLNIRKGPGTNYDVIGGIPNGTQVGVAADSGDWYLACYNGTYGWVSGDYLRG